MPKSILLPPAGQLTNAKVAGPLTNAPSAGRLMTAADAKDQCGAIPPRKDHRPRAPDVHRGGPGPGGESATGNSSAPNTSPSRTIAKRDGASPESCAQQLIAGSIVARRVAGVTRVTPSSEKVARELNRLPEDQQAEAWQQMVEQTDGEPSAAETREAVEIRLEPSTATAEPAIEIIDTAPSVTSETTPVAAMMVSTAEVKPWISKTKAKKFYSQSRLIRDAPDGRQRKGASVLGSCRAGPTSPERSDRDIAGAAGRRRRHARRRGAGAMSNGNGNVTMNALPGRSGRCSTRLAVASRGLGAGPRSRTRSSNGLGISGWPHSRCTAFYVAMLTGLGRASHRPVGLAGTPG